MLDKEKLLSHLHREDDRQLGGYILDQMELVKKRQSEQFTDFLNPHQRDIALNIIKQINDINYLVDGGYKEAERKRIGVFPDFLFPDHIEVPLCVLEIKGNFNFRSVSHGDFLGSLMGLGLKRKKVGDILVLEDRAQIVIAEENKETVLYELKSVHEVPVEVKEIDREDIEIPTRHTKDIQATVPSMRLDAVAGAGFGDSRGKISRDIEQGKVKLNWCPESDPAADVEVNDLISIRHRGRIKVAERRGLSNRGRIKLLLKRYT